MQNIRILKNNLIVVTGLPISLSTNIQLLKSNDYFSKYGTVIKISTNPQQPLKKSSIYQAYITYSNALDAALAITILDGFQIQGKPLKASIGTTKYCAYFLKGSACPNPECFYLHQSDKSNEVINKGDNKQIFDELNKKARDLVILHLNQILDQKFDHHQSNHHHGFPSIAKILQMLADKNLISNQYINKLVKKHKHQKYNNKFNKSNKSNSLSTISSTYKLQFLLTNQKIEQNTTPTDPNNINELNNNSTQNLNKQQKQQKLYPLSHIQKPQKLQKTTSLNPQQSLKNKSSQSPQSPQPTTIYKQLLKHTFKINEKSKSKMNFARKIQWNQLQKIKEILQKYLIISN